jgi:hypothetical protein
MHGPYNQKPYHLFVTFQSLAESSINPPEPRQSGFFVWSGVVVSTCIKTAQKRGKPPANRSAEKQHFAQFYFAKSAKSHPRHKKT